LSYDITIMKVIQSQYRAVAPYVTKDGSEIRELMHPSVHGNRRQSLAEATVAPGAQTALHMHRITEEIYHFTAGCGMMRLGSETFSVATGDTIIIPPGTPHCVDNTGDGPLKILCACAPAYSHDDTFLLTL
jgi:mannose-6-phosphate isomerase-like protein (cupin superfamily)